MRIAILLSTYNGGKYLEELLDSILGQSFCDWTLYIHDDGSTDDTTTIIKKYSQRYHQIEVLDCLSERLGAKDSFLKMLMNTEANYYFFCDQDDVWKPNKIKLELDVMKELEEKQPNLPLLIHSDLEVVDENLNTISSSFWKQSGINNRKLSTFNRLGCHNLVTGCTMLINKKAKDVVLYPATNATMHDAWISLCVVKAGGIIYGIDKALIKYRQHYFNVLGAKSSQRHSLFYKLFNIRSFVKRNVMTYKMLKELDYGSPFKYAFYKIVIYFGL